MPAIELKLDVDVSFRWWPLFTTARAGKFWWLWFGPLPRFGVEVEGGRWKSIRFFFR